MCAEKDTRRSGFPYDVDYPVSMHSQSMLQLLLRFDGRRSIFSLASLSDKERWASAQLHHKNQDNRSPGQLLSQLGSNRYEDLTQPDPSSCRISPLSNRLRQQNHQVPPQALPHLLLTSSRQEQYSSLHHSRYCNSCSHSGCCSSNSLSDVSAVLPNPAYK